MSRQQLSIDAFVFAREGGVLQGVLPVSELKRVHDQLADVSGEVRFSVQGKWAKGVLGAGESRLCLRLDGVLQLACQRCLGSIAFCLEVENLFRLVPEDTELTQDELEDDSCDVLPVAKVLDLVALIEDEILLALPVAPRHERCDVPGSDEMGKRVTPFAVLSGLKGKLN